VGEKIANFQLCYAVSSQLAAKVGPGFVTCGLSLRISAETV